MKENSHCIQNRVLGFAFKLLLLGPGSFTVFAQQCPPNIDFERANFDGWTCHVGFVVERNNQNVMRLSPTAQPAFNRHTIVPAGDEKDPYGGFPTSCPNGSGYSVKLGNTQGGALADGVSYEFTIPVDRNIFTLVYHYAIVFQEPDHLEHQQPRFEVEVLNVTTGQRLGCGTFEFRPFGQLTPGFDTTFDLVNNVRVWYKNWTPVTLNLNGQAGQTFRLFFKAADCTYFDHFAYAYLDINAECNGEFNAAGFCPTDTVANLAAPPGFMNYRWYDRDFTRVIGDQQVLTVPPLVAAAGPVPVEVFPYFGYGCIDTLYAVLGDTIVVNSDAGSDKISCNAAQVTIGSDPKPGYSYQWSPQQDLSNPAIANPLANPAVPTNYILRTSSSGGGCADLDTVFVDASAFNDSLQVLGELLYCKGNGDTLSFRLQHTGGIQWYRDGVAIMGANGQVYQPSASGRYYAVLNDDKGCAVSTEQNIVQIDAPVTGIRYPVKYVVTNLPTGLEARDFGDRITWTPPANLNDATITNPLFTGKTDQSYTIEIRTNGGCLTVDTQAVKVFPGIEINVPNAFTPNRDGRNDLLRPILVGIRELRYFRVFNRWGQLVYETRTLGTGWDGTSGNKPVSNQVMVWMVEAVGLDNRVYQRKGTSLVVR